jgi:4-hydroxy-tetrahydrodipicolinate reductase
MGRHAAAAVAGAPDMTLAVLYAPGHAGEAVGGQAVTDDPASMTGCDVIVELTTPAVVMDNLSRWRATGAHLVVGTSGFDSERLAHVEALWAASPGNCLVVPNFSIGAVLMMRLAEMAAPHFAGAEIVEMHHEAKVDAPSGTAVATAARLAEAAAALRSPRRPYASEARGALVDGIPVHSVRLPGIMARQEVVFGGHGETLAIRHDALDRSSYMPGLLAAVRAVADLPGVTVGLDAVLFD